MAKILTIGDASQDGSVVITDTRRESDGTMYVTVRENIGSGCWVGGLPVEKMRRLARRAVEYPQSARVVRKWSGQGCDHVTFEITE